MTTTTRRPSYLKAYTIIESLVVLVILSILSMVLLALFKYENEGTTKKEKAPPAPLSAAADPSPAPTIQEPKE